MVYEKNSPISKTANIVVIFQKNREKYLFLMFLLEISES